MSGQGTGKSKGVTRRQVIAGTGAALASAGLITLDSKNAEDLHNLLLKLNKELNQTIVVVTHNNSLAEITNRKLEIKDGII